MRLGDPGIEATGEDVGDPPLGICPLGCDHRASAIAITARGAADDELIRPGYG